MIVSRINGGLGNQMFQYALARKLAYWHNVKVELDLGDYNTQSAHKFSLKYLRAEASEASEQTLVLFQKSAGNNNSILERIKRRIFSPVSIKEENFRFANSVFTRSRPYTYLDGYWQSEQYFADIRLQLLKEFEPAVKMSETTEKMLLEIRNCNAVSLHIRRGDYVTNPSTNEYHGTCSAEYYDRAIEIISEKVADTVFYIFSDDIYWVKGNFRAPANTIYVEHTNAATNYEDLTLMRACRHNIIANSTFSWWGAWLNDNPEKMVVAPLRWFNRADLDSSDLVPKSWIQI